MTIANIIDRSIPQNAVLLEVKPSTEDYLRIVLCQRKRLYPPGREYVTWLVNLEDEGCSAGHYFDDVFDALADFRDRN